MKLIAVMLALLLFTLAFGQGSTSNVTIYVPATSLSQCAWPIQYAPGTPALAECRVVINGIPAIALAVNGGAFTLPTVAMPAKFGTLSCSAFARVGAGTKQSGCTEAP